MASTPSSSGGFWLQRASDDAGLAQCFRITCRRNRLFYYCLHQVDPSSTSALSDKYALWDQARKASTALTHTADVSGFPAWSSKSCKLFSMCRSHKTGSVFERSDWNDPCHFSEEQDLHKLQADPCFTWNKSGIRKTSTQIKFLDISNQSAFTAGALGLFAQIFEQGIKATAAGVILRSVLLPY